MQPASSAAGEFVSSLFLFLRNRLKYALSMKEAETFMKQRLIKIDGKTRTDPKFPTGFMDVVQIEKTGENFRIIYDVKGRFTVHRMGRRRGPREGRSIKERNWTRKRGEVGVVEKKKSLMIACLNVDGYNLGTMVDVEGMIRKKDVDIFCLTETKMRKKDSKKISKEGFDVFEKRREDCNSQGMMDKKGGGLAILVRKREGLVYQEHFQTIKDHNLAYVDKERMWITYSSEGGKTAVCCVYLGWGAKDERHKLWNKGILEVLSDEIFNLRGKGFRVNLHGDFNSWMGNDLNDLGIPGNNVKTTQNGEMFKEFLRANNLVHLNGAVRKQGDWSTRISSGLWTRHAPDHSSSSVLDFGVVSSEHVESVISFEVDETGLYGGGSDHNPIFTKLQDSFVYVHKIKETRKIRGWDIKEDQDWGHFKKTVMAETEARPEGGNVELEQNVLTEILIRGLEEGVGRRSPPRPFKDLRLPKMIVELLNKRRRLSSVWKTEKTVFASSRSSFPSHSLVVSRENLVEKEKEINEALVHFNRKKRSPIKKLCKMKNKRGRQVCWSYVSRKGKTNTDISALQDRETGVLHTKPTEIIDQVYLYLKDIFNGVEPENEECEGQERDKDDEGQDFSEVHCDHQYGAGPRVLHSTDSSKCPVKDPDGFLDRDFSVDEVVGILSHLGNGKAVGWDSIPNEALKEAPMVFVKRLVRIYNKIKDGGDVPSAWKKGRLVLLHKKG